MFGYEANEYDVKVYNEEIKDFVPDKIIDAHVHVYKQDFRLRVSTKWTAKVATECPYEDLNQTFADMFPGKKLKAVMMTMPNYDLDKGNEYIEECIGKGATGLYCTRYNTTPAEIEDAILNKGFVGIKPYICNGPAYIPINEIRIFDFLPHEHLKVMDSLGGIVLLHIGRDQRLKDPLNIAQLMEIEEKYPNLKLIVAHIGRAYSPEDLGNAFETLKHTKNMMFDFCATTFTDAMVECLKAVGPKRLMYGTDMPITKMRMRRISENGIYKNVIPKGLYGDVSDDIHMIETEGEDLTCFVYEEIRAFKRAAQLLKLTKEDINDVFYGNASRLFGMEF
ncbi:MAG: amidohydrolase family protein [Clostridia bacterium]|nr:amidohydrolase family protein [Clostridia bacterium]